MDRLVDLLTWSGIRERVELIKGPLNINLQALRKLNDTIGSLRQAGRLFPSFRYSFSEWLFLLRKTFMHARFQVPPDDEGGVQVLGLEETIGRAWSEVYLGGLVDGSFPQRLPQNIFLPEATLEALGVRTLENARMAAAYHFYRVLLSAPKVVLTRPENVGDKPVVPSPFLAELEPLRLAGLLRESSGIQFSLAIEDSLSVPELAKSVGAAGNVEGLEPLLAIDAEGMPAIGAALAERRTVPARPVIAPRRREFRVTELEEYLRCPYDYYVMNVLGIEPLAEVTEDLSPLDRGTRVHGILRDFYRAWTGPVTRERRKDAAALLASIAGRSFGYDADTFRNRREKELFLTIMAERFLDAEEGFWKQGMRPAYLEQKIEFFTLTLSDGETAEIHAKIDRIDVDEHGNFIIVDYKTGKYPQPTMTVDQEIFQLPLYAVMAKEALGGKDPTIRKPIGLAYYDLSGRVGPGARDVVLFDREARDDHPSIKPQASRKSPAEFGQILNMSVDKAKKAIEGILRGEFPATPLDENRCRYCQNEMLCERKEP
jgi:ATP-dependent helicase/nuclease subunit B